MNRRSFLSLPLLAVPLTPPLSIWQDDTPKKGIKVEAGKDRYGKSLNYLGGRFDLKVSGKDTNGSMCIYDTIRMEKVGPMLHIHPNLDEWFFVMEGDFKIQVGKEIFRLKAGDSLVGPRGVPHAFVKTSEGPARLLLSHAPAQSMEDLFEEASKMKDPTIEERQALMRRHDIIPVGPPLTPD